MANIRTSDTCAHRANSGRTAKKFIKIVQICLALVVALSLCACSGALNVTSVKTGHLTAYPDKTVGEAFDAFLGSPSWTAFTSEDGMEVVQCEGTCEYAGEEVNMIIQFIVEDGGETFSIYTMAIDGEPINKLLQVEFLEAVYGE